MYQLSFFSAGVGRTGTIILIDVCLKMAKLEGFIDSLAVLARMRHQRANMVDNHVSTI
jgi:protein tyrosine phosphatase